MEQILKDLMNNQKAFGLMSKEMQEKAKEIGKGEFLRFGGSNDWENIGDMHWHCYNTYRLRSEYKEEMTVEHEVVPDCNGELSYNDGILLSCAINDPNWEGCRYEGFDEPRHHLLMYLDINGDLLTIMYESSTSVRPTHVVFKK